MEFLVVLHDTATPSNASFVIPEDVSAAADLPTETQAVVLYPAAQLEEDSAFQNQVLSKLDTLIGLGTYLMAFFFFVVLVVLIRCVYKFIRLFI